MDAVGAPLRYLDPSGLEFRPARPESVAPGSKNGGHIICESGHPTFVINPEYQDAGCPVLRKCAGRHEQSHLVDAGPQVCDGTKGTVDLINPDRKNHLESEKRAFETEIKCLEKEQNPRTDGVQCTEACKTRVKDITDRLLKCVESGDYGRAKECKG